MEKHDQYANGARELLHELCTPHGILASSIVSDNYRRVWARDAIVAGIAGLLVRDETISQGLHRSLRTLADHQHELGMIPSNVLPYTGESSYGSLSGRIDASTWFIIGCCLYCLNSKNAQSWSSFREPVSKAYHFLRTVQYNDKGWIYTPLSGNWADEYPVHGYTLYDNCLFLWALKLLERIEPKRYPSPAALKERMRVNFWPETKNRQGVFHKEAYENAILNNKGFYTAFILPGYYDQRFDAAGNALALLLLEPAAQQLHRLKAFLATLADETKSALLPAFWPVIDEDHPDWKLLATNFSFAFKNSPGNFHNGGIWPVWNGLFCLGLASRGMMDQVQAIRSQYLKLLENDPSWSFHEYHNLNNLSPQGKTKMAYTASGILFMEAAFSISDTLPSWHLDG